jgi:transposase
MGKSRKRYSAEFKTKVVMEVLKGLKTINEIGVYYEVHPRQISRWLKEFKEKANEIFKKQPDIESLKLKQEKEMLQRKLGEVTMDVDYLKKKCIQFHIPLD